MRQCVTRLADNTGPAETNIEIIETDVTIECLPGSTLPAELRKAGYDITELDEGERILPAAIVEKFTRRGVSSEGWRVQQGQTCRGRSQSPVVWIAEAMETKTFEAYRQDLPRGGYESPGRNKSKRIVASKVSIPEGRASHARAKAT